MEDQNEVTIILEGEEVSNSLRTEDCGADASVVASLGPVRDALLERQRAFVTEPGLMPMVVIWEL